MDQTTQEQLIENLDRIAFALEGLNNNCTSQDGFKVTTADSLGSTVPPGSESVLREGAQEHWNLLIESDRRIKQLSGELDAANQHVKILEADRNSSIAACLRSCAQTIMENRMDGPSAAGYIAKYADSVQSNYQTPTPASGPGGFAAVPAGKWRVGSKVKLNVYDGDRPVCQCHSFMDANAIVAAMNRFEAQSPAFDFDDRPKSTPEKPDA